MNPTKEQLLKTKPPKDVIDELKSFSDTTGKAMPDIKDAFYSILVEPYLSAIEDINDRCRQASKILLAQLAEKLSYQTASMQFKIIDKTAIKEYDRKVKKEDPATGQQIEVTEKAYMARIYGFFAGVDDSEADYPTKFGVLSLWGDASQLTPKLQIDQAYSGSFGITDHESYYALTLNDNTELPVASIDIPPTKDIITNFFTAIPVSLAAQNLSEDRGDYKLILGRIKSKRVALSKKGKDIGWLDLIDTNATLEESKQDAFKLSIMFIESPEMTLRYETGSLVYVLCELSSSENYGLSAFGQLIVPIVGIPVRKPAQPSKPNNKATTSASANSGGNQKKASVPTKQPVQHSAVPGQGNAGSGQAPVPAESPADSSTSDDTGSWSDADIDSIKQETQNPTVEEPGPEDVIGW